MKQFFKHIIVTLLRAQARAVLKKFKPKVVAVTGSVGKTSTKDAIYEVLARTYHVRKSMKSFNSEIGLPLTILGLGNAWSNPIGWVQNLLDGLFVIFFAKQYPEWLVLEVGADRPGDIRGLASWLAVDVAVITRLPEVPVHVEFFNSPEEVIEEKASLIDAIKKGGALLLYADDPRTKALEHRLPAPDAKILTFGFGKEADIRADHIRMITEEGDFKWPVGMSAHITVDGVSVPVSVVGALGAHAFLPAIAAAGAGAALKMSVEDIVEGLKNYEAPQGRMRILPGLKESLIIDDTYNSSPAAVEAGLVTLGEISAKRRIAVVGDMLELGRHSVDEHKKIGALAAKAVDLLVTVGFRARDIAQGALDNGLADAKILQFEDSGKAGKELKNMITEGDAVLVKGSQSIRMERVVEELMLEPERAEELLVRQDQEWRQR
jgi:UDP-N-acetylmuramyl pentapeptide synthase